MTCTSGTIYNNGACRTCIAFGSSQCYLCPDFVYVARGSGPAQCVSCSSLYGADCIRCTTSVCTDCAYSSNTVLALDGSGCQAGNCTVNNCVICYAGGTSCYRCQQGYQVATNGSCLSTTCSIANCQLCNGALCSNCFPGYSRSNDQLVCNPVCSDVFCSNCIGPEVCGTCVSPYIPDSAGKCILDCTKIAVANCAECTSNT